MFQLATRENSNVQRRTVSSPTPSSATNTTSVSEMSRRPSSVRTDFSSRPATPTASSAIIPLMWSAALGSLSVSTSVQFKL